MPKIQGKQLAENTITQDLLNLATPLSGDTFSGTTVEYVNNAITSITGSTVIGQAEDPSGYVDGIFTDFTPSTPVGTAIDRFNEMLLLLAPSVPNSSWDNVFSNLTFNETLYSARALTSGSAVSNITIVTTPTFTLTDTVGTETNARALPTGTNTLTFTLTDSVNGIIETEVINSGSTGDASGLIQYTVADPYQGISGKQGFWTGITAFSVTGDITPALIANSTQRTLTFTHVGIDSPETFNYYLDSPLTVTIGTISATMPAMTRYISGVPSLATGDVITGIGFNINNVASYFYAATSVYQINAGLVGGSTGDPNTIPTNSGETGTVTGKTATVLTGQYSDTTFTFTVRGRNSIGTYGSNTTYTNGAYRVDTVSVETSRLISGSGSYPAGGYGGVYDSTQSLVGTYTEELMMKNNIYQYPSIDYTAFGGPDYSTASGTRWVTFNLGTFTNNAAFTLNFIGSTGISVIYGQADLLVEVKISGATSWVDGDAAYSGSGNPGSGADGVAAVVVGSSTATSRRITFGSITYSGAIIVRIGLTNSGVTFTGLTATSLV
jgi:hypothetical protein